MLKVSDLVGRRALQPKRQRSAKDEGEGERLQKLGKVHNAVFSPSGRLVIGLMVRRPDVAGVVKRDDVFVALDSFKVDGPHVVVTRPEDGTDAAAIRRLGVDWDSCIIWTGMDVRTVDGKSLGYVSDAEFDERTGRVERFSATDGGMSHALVGSFVITADMVVGYSDGRMVVETGGRSVELDGGLAGAAGARYARAKAKGSEVGKKVGAVAGEAVDKGSFALGRAIGKAKRAISEATAEEREPESQAPAIEAADVRVERPTEGLPKTAGADAPERPEPKTYVPAPEDAQEASDTDAQAAKAGATGEGTARKAAQSKKPAAKKSATTGERVARAAGKQLGSLGKMFGSFKEEFDKASK